MSFQNSNNSFENNPLPELTLEGGATSVRQALSHEAFGMMIAQAGGGGRPERNPISDLNADDWRTRESATQDLRRQGVAALPAMMGALDQQPRTVSLEQTRRMEGLVNEFRGNRLGELIDGMGHRDASVRQASSALMGRVPTSDLLDAVTRGGLSAAQQERVRSTVSDRNSAEELERTYGPSKLAGRDEFTARHSLGHAMLFNPGRVPEASATLGNAIAAGGNPDRLGEAATLLQRGATSNDANVRLDALTGLTTVRSMQGIPQDFTDAMRRLRPAIAQAEAGGNSFAARDAHQVAAQATERMLAIPDLPRADRERITQLQTELRQDRAAFDERNPPWGGKKK